MKYCKNCGGQIEDDAKFCVYCGSKVEEVKEEVEVVEAKAVEVTCPICGTKVSSNETNCPVCGALIKKDYYKKETTANTSNKKKDPVMMGGFICSIAGFIISGNVVALIISLAGTVMGIIGMSRAKTNNSPKGFAVAAIIFGFVGIATSLFWIIFGDEIMAYLKEMMEQLVNGMN